MFYYLLVEEPRCSHSWGHRCSHSEQSECPQLVLHSGHPGQGRVWPDILTFNKVTARCKRRELEMPRQCARSTTQLAGIPISRCFRHRDCTWLRVGSAPSGCTSLTSIVDGNSTHHCVIQDKETAVEMTRRLSDPESLMSAATIKLQYEVAAAWLAHHGGPGSNDVSPSGKVLPVYRLTQRFKDKDFKNTLAKTETEVCLPPKDLKKYMRGASPSNLHYTSPPPKPCPESPSKKKHDWGGDLSPRKRRY